MEQTLEIFGKRLRQERKHTGLSVEQAASKAGISAEELTDIEAGGGLDSVVMRRLAAVYEATPYSLFSEQRYKFLEQVGPPDSPQAAAMRKFALQRLEDIAFVRREHARLQKSDKLEQA